MGVQWKQVELPARAVTARIISGEIDNRVVAGLKFRFGSTKLGRPTWIFEAACCDINKCPLM